MFLGIDPGLTGALALYDPKFNVIVNAFPVPVVHGKKSKLLLDLHALVHRTRSLVQDYPGTHAVLELVGAMPGQGVTSMFNFGRTAGALESLLVALDIPYTKVPPAVWKRSLGCSKDKGATMLRASQLMPTSTSAWQPIKDERTKEQCNGIAEAALIAYYGARLQGENFLS